MTILLTIILLTILFFIYPFITFGLGWLLGWVIKITIGGLIVNGFNLVGLHIPLESLPLFFGVLSVVAGFFRNFSELSTFGKDKK